MEKDDSRQSIMIRANLADLRRRVDNAAVAADREAGKIEIVAVTKGHPASTIRAAYQAGLRDFGENYVQEARAKQAELADLEGIRWHFIGHLQSNKVSDVAGTFALIQSIDSERLARKVCDAAEQRETVQDILVQVRLGDEPTKSGVPIEDAPALCEFAYRHGGAGLRLRGLMGIAPGIGDPRPHFAKLAALYETLPSDARRVLSIGMSADFEAAIKEGATMVRIGTALVGSRKTKQS